MIEPDTANVSPAEIARFDQLAARWWDPDGESRPLHDLNPVRAGGSLELAGPFGNQPGGAYLLRAPSLDEARRIAHEDPAHTSGGWDITVYEWQAR